MVEIIQAEHAVLRETAKEVPPKDIGGSKIKKVLKDMKEALASQDDGVAIAAPQISVSLRIFIVAGKFFDYAQEAEKGTNQDLVFINPVISKLSKDKDDMEEGCLSIRWKYGKVFRSTKATVTAYDEQGKKFSYNATGILAQIFQHETDHLDGVLFIDKAHDVADIIPEHE